MSDQIERGQEDFFHRLNADSFFADVPVLAEHRGVTEDDIAQSLSTLKEKSGLLGLVAIVLEPNLKPDAPNAPGPRSIIRIVVQVIDQPLGSTVGKTFSQAAERVRMVLHHFRDGSGGTWVFDGQEPVVMEPGKRSYGVAFVRIGVDNPPAKVSQVLISAAGTVAPQTVTLTCATAAASIYYTTDGSYPASTNAAATLYTVPFSFATAGTLRAAATKTGLQQSDVSQSIFT